MTIQLSTAVRHAMLEAVETTIGLGATLRVRTGPTPASTAAGDTGTVLATIALPDDWMAPPAGGVKAGQGAWIDTGADAAGLAGHARFHSADGVCHLQGLVSQPWAPSTGFLLGQQVHNGGQVYRCTVAGQSAAAGGPAGQGGAIADGSATWAHLGGVFMTMDNTSFAVGQRLTVADFTLTAPNA